MENMIPLNGRIAIVDDKIEQALPLMRVFSKNNIPYTYYQGNLMEFLPDNPENDIRLLFLDLNLYEGRDNKPQDIKSSLFSVISHIISPNNYPYVIILWSRQENEYSGLLKELFSDSPLKECAPITILNWIKSDFFPNFSDEEVNKDGENKIIEELIKVLLTLPAYSYLMQWENCVHHSADATIQDIFKDFHSQENWQDNANCILDMFAHSYLEKNYDNSTPEKKAKASLLFLNDVYNDTLESKVSNVQILNATELQYEDSEEKRNIIIAKINRSLLISNQRESINQPGCVLSYNSIEGVINHYHKIFNDSISFKGLPNREIKEIKKNIYVNLLPCDVVVTPACDYAQKKSAYDRIVQGVIIDAEFKPYINNNSEAIYVSPVFEHESRKCIIVLNYRYFKTNNLEDAQGLNFLFRIRTSLLSEIQSKLSRHINRQGIMNL